MGLRDIRISAKLVLIGVGVSACATGGGPAQRTASVPAPAPLAVSSGPPTSQVSAACGELARMVDATYGFQPSKLTKSEYDAKAKQLDAVWSYTQAHAAEVKGCLRQMLEVPRPGSYFPIDGAALLVKVDPTSASRALQARLLTDANLADVDPRTWVETLAHLGVDGIDISKAGRRWLTEPNLKYHLPEHGGYEVTAYDGGVFLFGSMDEAQARPALVDMARDPHSPGRLNALWLLLFQATPGAREALRGLPLDDVPAKARAGITEALAAPTPADTPYQTIPVFTRAELVSALQARGRDEREAFDRLAENDRFVDSGAQVLLPADEVGVRQLRRKLVARSNQHGLDDYILLSRLLMAMQLRARTPSGQASVDGAFPASSPALSAFVVPQGELPPGITMTAGDPTCVSTEPLTFFARPALVGVPRPRARQALVLRRGNDLIGSILLFDYGAGQLPKVRLSLDRMLWGEARVPSPAFPEQIVEVGDTLLILCLPGEDPAIAWYRDRLYVHHHARVTRTCAGVAAVKRDMQHLEEHVSYEQAVGDVFYRHQDDLLACSTGAALLGDVARGRHDWPRAEKAYRRAIELDDKGDLFATPATGWSARDGLAVAVALQKRSAESVSLFEAALTVAQKVAPSAEVAFAQYNLACAYAEVGRFSEAALALKAAIKIDPTFKEKARTDDSFRKARGQPQFNWLAR
jgi:tetratricopeptide (TPR) repeat protein